MYTPLGVACMAASSMPNEGANVAPATGSAIGALPLDAQPSATRATSAIRCVMYATALALAPRDGRRSKRAKRSTAQTLVLLLSVSRFSPVSHRAESGRRGSQSRVQPVADLHEQNVIRPRREQCGAIARE